MTIKLSLCIATFKRARYIGETVDAIVSQLTDEVELVILDGASPDDTQTVVERHSRGDPRVRYVREPVNSGIDQDFDKAVGHAHGEYCWLMSDDDLLVPGAIERVLRELDGNVDLVAVNASVWNADFSVLLRPRMLALQDDARWSTPGGEGLFAQVADYLSFIGGVVVRREYWRQRQRAPYYGTYFVHIGVLFQSPPVERAVVIAEPLIRIRYGNATWSSRSFEIWMFKWPQLVWSFAHFSPAARLAVSAVRPFDSPKHLFFMRGVGSYTRAEYTQFLRTLPGQGARWPRALIAQTPGWMANLCCGLYYLLRPRKRLGMELYDLARTQQSSWLTRQVARTRELL